MGNICIYNHNNCYICMDSLRGDEKEEIIKIANFKFTVNKITGPRIETVVVEVLE